jgi:maltose-binding protein MalE
MKDRGLNRFRVAIATLLLAMTAVMGIGAGAAAQDTPSELEGELTFWHGLGTEAAVLNDVIVPMWEEQYPNVTLDILQVPFDQLRNKYITEASAGGGPDVLLGPSDWVGEFVDIDIALALDELATDEVRAGYNQAGLDIFTFDGSLRGIPQNINGIAMFYNKALVPEPPTTTDELLAVAADLAGTPDTYGLGVFPQFYNNAGYLYGFGGQVLNDDGTSAFDSPEATEWLSFVQTLSTSPGVFVGTDQNSIESLFREGKLGLMFNGPWFIQGATDGIGAENVGVALMPAISPKENAPARPFVGATGLYVNSNLDDDQAALAFEFARWFSTTGTQPLVDEAGQLPAATSVQIAADDPYGATFVEQYATGVALPNSPRMGVVWAPADDMLAKVMRGEAQPADAAASAAETIDSAG